jgi:hypothetical protein
MSWEINNYKVMRVMLSRGTTINEINKMRNNNVEKMAPLGTPGWLGELLNNFI